MMYLFPHNLDNTKMIILLNHCQLPDKNYIFVLTCTSSIKDEVLTCFHLYLPFLYFFLNCLFVSFAHFCSF